MYSLRVYYEDTDAGGVVYNANYLRFFERARTEFLRDLGVDIKDWIERGVSFVVSEASLKFHRAARYGDQLSISTAPSEITAAAFLLTHNVHREKELIVSGSTKMVCVGPGLKPRRIPEAIVHSLGSYR